jgi:hypothetical protein
MTLRPAHRPAQDMRRRSRFPLGKSPTPAHAYDLRMTRACSGVAARVGRVRQGAHLSHHTQASMSPAGDLRALYTGAITSLGPNDRPTLGAKRSCCGMLGGGARRAIQPAGGVECVIPRTICRSIK